MEDFIERNREKLVEITREILKVKSVEEPPAEGMPFGRGVFLALEKALEISEGLGLKTRNIDNVLGYAEYGEEEDTLSILGHLDVVPEGKDWTYPPYGAEIHDGKIYARGAVDDKGPTMAALFALYALKETQAKLSKKVRVVFGTNEESGWECMRYFREKVDGVLRGFAPDGRFPVINREKGIMNVTIRKDFTEQNSEVLVKGGERPNMVPDFVQAVFKNKPAPSLDSPDIIVDREKIVARGISAHASLPERGKNAIVILAASLKDYTFSSEAGKVIKFINEFVGFDYYGNGLGIALEDEPSGKLTVNLGMIDVNEKFAELIFNIRYPVTETAEHVKDLIEKRIDGTGFYVKHMSFQKPLFVEESSPVVQKLLSAYKEVTGFDAFTLAIGGGTYARAMDEGVAFGPTLPGQEEVEHMANEYISIDHLVLLAKIYAKAILKLAE